MAARKKTVFDSREIAHLWFHSHESQEYARNSQDNFYFSGDTIYSYGRHFPIARIGCHKGQRYVLFTNRTWSSTTAKHLSWTRQAIPQGTPVFYVNDVTEPLKDCLDDFAERVKRAEFEVITAKNKVSRAKRYGILSGAVRDANAFAEFFGLRRRFKLVETANVDELREIHKKREAAAAKREAAARRKLERENAKHNEAAVAAWRAGIGRYPNFRGLFNRPHLLRISGDVVQTSEGAEFPVRHALRALPFVERLLRNGQDFHRNGRRIPLGLFEIDRIESDGTVVAGCHRVERAEIERLIAALKELPAVDHSTGDYAENESELQTV